MQPGEQATSLLSQQRGLDLGPVDQRDQPRHGDLIELIRRDLQLTFVKCERTGRQAQSLGLLLQTKQLADQPGGFDRFARHQCAQRLGQFGAEHAAQIRSCQQSCQ